MLQSLFPEVSGRGCLRLPLSNVSLLLSYCLLVIRASSCGPGVSHIMVCVRIPHPAFPGVTIHQAADLSTEHTAQGGLALPASQLAETAADSHLPDGQLHQHHQHVDGGAAATEHEMSMWQVVEQLIRTGPQQHRQDEDDVTSRQIAGCSHINTSHREQQLWSLIESTHVTSTQHCLNVAPTTVQS